MLSVVWSLALWLLAPGLFGLTTDAPASTHVTATVTKGAGCGDAPDGELVTFKQDGKEHNAKFDGCGHRAGEPVDVGVPSAAGVGELVVHAAEATTGESDGRRPLAFILFLLSNLAGGGLAYRYFSPQH